MNLFEAFNEVLFTNTTPKNGEKKTAVVPKKQPESFTLPNSVDGATILPMGAVTQSEWIEGNQTEKQLIETYRRIAKFPEVEEAIDIIVQESFSEDDEGNIVTLNTDSLDVDDKVKKKMKEEFQNVLKIIDFQNRGADFFKRWYIDGRIAFHKVIDKEHPKDGILECRYINPSTLEKVIEYQEVMDKNNVVMFKTVGEYFHYDPANRTNIVDFGAGGNIGTNSYNISSFWSQMDYGSLYAQNQKVRVDPDAIAFCTSGFYDEDFDCVLSYLHRAVKVANNLSMMEDSLVIYRMLRSTEQRIFYIETGDLNPAKAQQYVQEAMTKYKSDLSYDSVFGGAKDGRRFCAITEDIWIPRKDGKNSEVSKLEAGDNLGEMEDVQYFLKKLYKALKIPVGRVMNESQTIGLGRESEITREELAFQKFIDKLRRNFSKLIMDIFRTQCVLKCVVDQDDWDSDIDGNIKIEWSNDLFTTELKEQDILKERVNTLQTVESYIGKYVTEDYVYKNIMRYDDETIKELKSNADDIVSDPDEIDY